jgi:hypothetical protein
MPCSILRKRAQRATAPLLLAAVLSACAPAAVAPPPSPALPPTQAPLPAQAPKATADPEAWYASPDAAGERILRINTAASLIAVTVHRAGALAALGHDHVVASRTVSGYVAPDQGRADFHFRLDAMTVDEPVLRHEAGFDTQPSTDAIAGTRNNMLTKVLDAERYPLVAVHVARSRPGAPLDVDVTLHGVTRRYTVAATMEDRDGTLLAGGTVSLKQSDFGIVPFAVMGGALAVGDQLDLRFSIAARP